MKKYAPGYGTFDTLILGNSRVEMGIDPKHDCFRCVALNSASSAVIDSYLSEAHVVGFDSQAICGVNGPGPFKIVNNYLEGSGENIMFGGADPAIRDLVPSDIEFRGNYCFKPLSWKIGHPSYAGIPWAVKNLFELKNARRVLIEGNVFENNWVHAQNGTGGAAPGALGDPVLSGYGPLAPGAPTRLRLASATPLSSGRKRPFSLAFI